jgi:hypothetical protein
LRGGGRCDRNGSRQRGVVNETSAHDCKYKPKGQPKRKLVAFHGIGRTLSTGIRGNTVAKL